jgi:hypothetical protein
MKQATNKVKSAKESEVRNDRALQVHELRPSFVRPEDTKHVLTNHFTIELLDILHHFVVSGLEDEAVADKGTTGGKVDQATGDTDDDETKLPPSGKQRLVMTTIIDSTDALKQKKHLYATDKMRHIVSWNTPEDLFQLAAVNAGDTVAQATYTSREAVPRKQLAAVVKDLKLQYKGRIHVSDLVAAATGEKAQFSVELSDTRTITVDQALNMIITKATMASSMDLFRVASNKILWKTIRRNSLLRSSLIMVSTPPSRLVWEHRFSTLAQRRAHSTSHSAFWDF